MNEALSLHNILLRERKNQEKLYKAFEMLSRTRNAVMPYWQLSNWYILSTKWTTLGSFFPKAYEYMTTLSAFLLKACGPWQCIHRHSTSKLHTVKEPHMDCENTDWLYFSAVDRRLACNQSHPSMVCNDHINAALACKRGMSHKVLSTTQFDDSRWVCDAGLLAGSCHNVLANGCVHIL